MGEPNPNHDPTRLEHHHQEDLIQPDPLLDSGTFIHIDDDDDVINPTPLQTLKPSSDSGDDVVINPTPLQTLKPESDSGFSDGNGSDVSKTPGSVKKSKRQPEDMVERPDWLPLDWRIEVRMRTSGATAGTYDRYYISPTGKKFRSKTEVLHFLETGSTKKKKADADAMPPASSKQKDKKLKRKRGDFSGVDFDFRNPPENVCWTLTNASHDIWMPVGDEGLTPEAVKRTWDTTFSCITELELGK